MTPPLTPIGPADADAEPAPQQSLFHNYLRALHDFDPKSSSTPGEDASMLTAKLKAGDLILVHCIHANGWADGTVLNSGERAWLPTNYCEGYDHPYLRNLLNAMTQFWDLLGASEDANLSTFVRQDYIRGLIAGVRYLLERADCLHRDVPLVKAHVGVRRMRKGLLADLSSLVQIAKRLQETISEPFAGEVIHFLLEDLITKACKVVTRAVSFLDVWTKETSSRGDELGWLSVPESANEPSPSNAPQLNIDTNAVAKDEPSSAVDSAMALMDDNKAEAEHDVEQTAEPAVVALPIAETPKDKTARLSVVFTPPAGTVAHRLSLMRRDTSHSVVSTPLASEQLAKAHDICISHIGAFIGHHLHSRPCSELVATTDRLVQACKNMLIIVDEVCERDPHNCAQVRKVKAEFESKVEELARSTKDVFKFSDSPDDEEIMMPDQSSHLITVGTDLIRNTAECVMKTRNVIEQIGDFELKAWVVSSPVTTQPMSDMLPTPPPKEPQSPEREITLTPAKRFSVEKRFSMEKRYSIERRLSKKSLPPLPQAPPVPNPRVLTAISTDVPVTSPIDVMETPITPAITSIRQSLPTPAAPVVSRHRSATRVSQTSSNLAESLRRPYSVRSDSISPARKDSIGMSTSGSTDTFASSVRDSSMTNNSQGSTRATTPDQTKDSPKTESAMIGSFASLSDMPYLVADEQNDHEATLLQKTYANELTLKEDGQVSGGSLPALVEHLTQHDSAPDPVFLTTFFVTFRKFCDPRDFAQALIARFDYIGDSKTVGMPARLRIFNIFKYWLETYWSPDADKEALTEIENFAAFKLKQHLPAAGDRLADLVRKVSIGYRDGTLTGPGVSGVGKTILTIGMSYENEASAPGPIVSKSQLNSLRNAVGGGSQCSIMDFEAMEVARQITMLTMKTFCDIRAEELLSMDWGKNNTQKARNVRKMCLLNTDLANFVGDTILTPDEAKKRAAVIKQWSKIGHAFLELHNYDSLMSIMATLQSSVVQRLKRTWEIVSKKTKARIDELAQVCDMSKNYSSLRSRLAEPVAPCLPFVGIYLTDLTFVIAGNPKRRELPGSTSETGGPVSVINFDMYVRISKIITNLQKFQVPYKLKDVPEMQNWIEENLIRMREDHDKLVSSFHRRSLFIEPKQ
ncbi:ras GEF, partial [Dissoconium aciculare CBS 342.82]|uniref:Ras GEF n=1 Tax=Dissoconium aciculare CBS 342.82 TaxID=1314786 RepID=A0A6J3LWT9_9PEZI